jgi:hypothetical protein
MTDRTFHRIAAAAWYALLIALFLLAYRCKAQIVKPALPAQHHLAPHTAPPVRPATACRVCTASGPVTGWEPCSKAHRTAQRLTAHGFYAWVESKTGGKP